MSQAYNALSELCVVCPITSTVRGSSFEVQIPDGHAATGAILTNQLRAVSWPSRGANDPPPLKWSDLRYVFDTKEDCNGKEAIQA